MTTRSERAPGSAGTTPNNTGASAISLVHKPAFVLHDLSPSPPMSVRRHLPPHLSPRYQIAFDLGTKDLWILLSDSPLLPYPPPLPPSLPPPYSNSTPSLPFHHLNSPPLLLLPPSFFPPPSPPLPPPPLALGSASGPSARTSPRAPANH